MKKHILSLALFGLLSAVSAQAAQDAQSVTTPSTAAKPADPKTLALVKEQARLAGGLAGLMKQCTILATDSQRQALVDYQRTILDLGEENGMALEELDALVVGARDEVVKNVPVGGQAALCDAARARLIELTKRFSLFQMTPPLAPQSDQQAAEVVDTLLSGRLDSSESAEAEVTPAVRVKPAVKIGAKGGAKPSGADNTRKQEARAAAAGH